MPEPVRFSTRNYCSCKRDQATWYVDKCSGMLLKKVWSAIKKWTYHFHLPRACRIKSFPCSLNMKKKKRNTHFLRFILNTCSELKSKVRMCSNFEADCYGWKDMRLLLFWLSCVWHDLTIIIISCLSWLPLSFICNSLEQENWWLFIEWSLAMPQEFSS